MRNAISHRRHPWPARNLASGRAWARRRCPHGRPIHRDPTGCAADRAPRSAQGFRAILQASISDSRQYPKLLVRKAPVPGLILPACHFSSLGSSIMSNCMPPRGGLVARLNSIFALHIPSGARKRQTSHACSSESVLNMFLRETGVLPAASEIHPADFCSLSVHCYLIWQIVSLSSPISLEFASEVMHLQFEFAGIRA